MKKILKIGSRESRLAVAQAEQLAAFCRARGIPCEIVTRKTTGDKILDRRLDEVGGKGLFVKELDLALRAGETDVSVHSAKDLPAELPDDLPILGFSRREDPRDTLVLPQGCTVWDRTLPVGCASRRRALQLGALYPGLRFETVRGNVLTRLKKLDGGRTYGALILAAAGLKRLGLEGRISRYFSPEEIIPAAGQGVLCVQGRAGEDYSFLAPFFDESAGLEVRAERAFVRALDGGCSSPIAAFAVRGKRPDGPVLYNAVAIRLRGLYYSESRGVCCTSGIFGPAKEPEMLGRLLAQHLKEDAEGAAAP